MDIGQTGLVSQGHVNMTPVASGQPAKADTPPIVDSVTLEGANNSSSVDPAFVKDALKDSTASAPDSPKSEEKRSLRDAARTLLTPSELWSVDLPSSGVGFHGTLITKDGALCSAHDETLTCVDQNSGNILWQHEFDDLIGVLNPDTGRDGTIFSVLNNNENELYAIDPQTGQEKWSINTNTWYCAPRTGPDGTIYAEKGGRLIALNPDGTKKFQFKPKGKDNRIHSIAGIDSEGNIFVKCNDGVTAVSPAGKELWNVPGNSIDFAYFSHDPSHLYQHRDYEISQIDKNTGEKTWQIDTVLGFPLKYYEFLGLYQDRLVLAGNRGEGDSTKLMCIDATNGKTLWTGKRSCNFKLFCGDGRESLLFTGGKKRIDRINPDTGKELWTFSVPNQEVWAGTVSRDGILFASAGDTVYGLDTEKGDKKFTFKTGSKIKDLILSSDETTLFIREEDENRITAVRLKEKSSTSGESSSDSSPGIQTFEELVDIGGIRILRHR